VSKAEVFGIAISSFGIGLGLSLVVPSFYEVLNRFLLLLIDRVIIPYYPVWMVISLLSILFFYLLYLHYEEQLAMFYRVFWVWGTTALFSWFGGAVILHDLRVGLLLWGVGIVLGLFFRWIAPPHTKFLVWGDIGS